MSNRILFLESDPLRQVGFRAALAASGYLGVAASGPEDAAALLASRSFDLVLLGPDEPSDALGLAAMEQRPPVVALAILPDCVIGTGLPGRKPPPDLPAILEALTRYVRFAPPRVQETPAEYEQLLEQWAAFERGST